MPGSTELQPGRHLRLLVESDGTQTRLLEATVVEESLPQPAAILGPVVYASRVNGMVASMGTMADPFERRSLPRRGEHEHHYSRADKATFVLRVPLPVDGLPMDLDIDVRRVGEAVPERPEDLRQMLVTGAISLGVRIAHVDLDMLRSLPGWEVIKSQVEG